jgi:predicted phosphodiesterase
MLKVRQIMIDPAKPLLVFGGPYSNLEATEALFREAFRLTLPASNIVCTGDVIAYAARPEETANLIRSSGIAVVAGNCEVQLAAGADDCGCGFEDGSACDRLSRGWYPFALAHTSKATRDWMATLPPRLDLNYCGLTLAILHGGSHQNNRFLFASETAALEAEIALARADHPCDVVIAGHAGIPFVKPLRHGTWVNAGVIGMPANDATTHGWYALLTPGETGVNLALKRLTYDHLTAAAAMRRAGHANGYARTLVTGLWPSVDVLPEAERTRTGIPIAETTYSLVPTRIAA